MSDIEMQHLIFHALVHSKVVSDFALLLRFVRYALLFDKLELAGIEFREEDIALELVVDFGKVYAAAMGAVDQFAVQPSSANDKNLVNLSSIDKFLQNLHSVWKTWHHVVPLWDLGQCLAHHNVYPVGQRSELRR